MAVLTTLRTATACPPSGLHPYIDTPDFAYDQWLSYLGENPIGGNLPGSPSVAVIGGGASGLCAAYELQRAGCSVYVYEQESEVGGRCASHRFSTLSPDVAEMGSMRFPPTEFILDYYMKKFGILPGGLCSQPDFPDPGVALTYVCYGAGPIPPPWLKTKNTPYPAGFKTVAEGWGAFYDDGFDGLPGAPTITKALAAGTKKGIDDATTYWRNYLKRFGQQTFYGALNEIFTSASPPGGKKWTFEDFDRFGALGLGSGGFGPLYPISFMDIFRLLVNELETTQKFLQPSNTLKNGIRTLPLTFADKIGPNYVQTGAVIKRIVPSNTGLSFKLIRKDGHQYGPFDRVIVATTTRAMEVSLGLTAYSPRLVSPAVAQAIMRTHVVSSNKVAARIKNFWSHDRKAIRCLQTDDLVHQVYTLDYTPLGAPIFDPTGVCFISYVWDDDAVKQQAITSGQPTGPADNKLLYDYLLDRLATIGEPVASWAKTNLQPLDGDYANNVVFEEWQSSPYFAGAFKLSQPGQDKYVQQMFFDYQKCGTTHDTGVYIAGDCVSWTSGWVEGALTTGLNAAAGVFKSLRGTLNPDANGQTPLKIDAKRYTYF